ncbi:hypothetical protein C0214_10860 [Methylobacterium sp. DM1]|nr:hypothetical protein C0214_10860 [Methylobacterium sp. DM1]
MADHDDTLAKVEAAREAVAEAAALLLRHAEGLALLRLVALRSDFSVPRMVTTGGLALLPDRQVEDAYRTAVVAATRFAGEHHALDEVVASRTRRPRAAALRRAVEETVGDTWGAMPPPWAPPGIEARHGFKPARVLRQAWRDHLAATAVAARPKLVKVQTR